MDLRIDCGRIPELISADLIVYINEVVTELGAHEGIDAQNLRVMLDGVDLVKPEDHHDVLNPGTVETLVEQILPRQCREDNDVLWLCAVIMYEISRGQPFVNGNKRTAVLAANMFLIEAQDLVTDKEAKFSFAITDELITDIAAVARGELGRKDLYELMVAAVGDAPT